MRDYIPFCHRDKNQPYGGFDTTIITNGFGDKRSELLIRFTPPTETSTFMEVGTNLHFMSGMSEAEYPLEIRFLGDSEMRTFYGSICFLKEILEGLMEHNAYFNPEMKGCSDGRGKEL